MSKQYATKAEQLLREMLTVAGKLVGLTLTGHPIVGCVGGLNKAVYQLAAMLG